MSRFDRMLATILSKRSLIADDQRESLIAECERLGQPLPDILLRRRICREPVLIAAVADELNCHPILIDHVTPSPEALQLLTGEECLQHEVLPISRLGNTLTLAVANPFDEPRLDQIRTATGCEVIPVLSSAPSLKRKLKACFPDLPIQLDETPEQEQAETGGPDQDGVAASWLNLAEELEKEAIQPSTPDTQPPQEQPQQEQPPVEKEVILADEVQLDLGPIATDEAPPFSDQLTQPDVTPQEQVSDTAPPPAPQEQSPAPAAQQEIQFEAPAQEERVVQEEVIVQETSVTSPPAPGPSGPAIEPEVRLEDTNIEAGGEAESEVQTEAPAQPPPQPEAVPASMEESETPSASIAERTWADIVAAAETRATRVSWWRAAEAGVPSANEELQGEDAEALHLARALLLDAFEQGFEELIFDSAEDGLHILERTARVLRPLVVAPRDLQSALLNRLKWIAGLKPNERRAQTGSFQAAARGREFVCRLHVLPTILGERLQLELAPAAIFSGGLEALGIAGPGADDYRWAVANPAGLLLLAAPPGHGREPALRALLGLSRPNGEQAIALENPVLVRMPGVTQVAVGRSAGLGTADALRTALRRAPDRLVITDMRDAETVRLAVQAAASGSLVLAGMDAPDVFCALARLADCGLPPFTLASALRLAASQRSLRRLCERCRESIPMNPDLLLTAGCGEHDLAGASVFRPVGCSACRHGYSGRVHVYETLRITGDLRTLVRSGAPVTEWRNKTMAWGFRTLRKTALRLVLQGQTSLEEVLVATPEDV